MQTRHVSCDIATVCLNTVYVTVTLQITNVTNHQQTSHHLLQLHSIRHWIQLRSDIISGRTTTQGPKVSFCRHTIYWR